MNEISKEHEFNFDLATLDIKGKRFREAEQKFQNLVRESQRSEAWCGLGAAKFGLILEDVTVQEVFYCFEKARSAGGEKQDLDNVVLGLSETAIQQLTALYVKATQAERNAQQQALRSVLAAGFSTFASLGNANSGRTINSIVWAANASINYSDYVKADSTVQQLKELQSKTKGLLDEIKAHVVESLGQDNVILSNFKSACAGLEADAEKLLLTEDEKKKIEQRNTEAYNEERRQRYIEANKYILVDENNPFHKYKNEATTLVKMKKYKDAINKIDAARAIYTQDVELNNMREEAVKIHLGKRALWDLAIAAIILLALYIIKGSFNNSNFVDVYSVLVACVVGYRYYIGYKKYNS